MGSTRAGYVVGCTGTAGAGAGLGTRFFRARASATVHGEIGGAHNSFKFFGFAFRTTHLRFVVFLDDQQFEQLTAV